MMIHDVDTGNDWEQGLPAELFDEKFGFDGNGNAFQTVTEGWGPWKTTHTVPTTHELFWFPKTREVALELIEQLHGLGEGDMHHVKVSFSFYEA
jgi:hypothetical protein